MKNKILLHQRSFVLFFIVLMTFGVSVQAQLATWTLNNTTKFTPSGVAANITAGLMNADAALGTSFNASGYRVKQGVGNWPASVPTTDLFFIDFPLSPKTGFDATVTGITCNIGATTIASGISMLLNPYYQIDGKGKWYKLANAQSFNLVTPINFGTINQPFYSGHTYVIRFFVTGLNSATKNDNFYLNNVVINGNTTTNSVVPNITLTSATATGKYTATGLGNYEFSGVALVNAGKQLVDQSGVCWSVNTNPTVLLPTKTTDGLNGNINSAITGLNANTTYFVRAYAITQLDTLYSNSLSFTTNPASLPIVSTMPITNILGNKATSGGNIIDSGGLPILTKGVCWSTGTLPTLADPHTNDGKTAANFVSSMKVLLPNTNYCVRAYAQNALGVAYDANSVCFTTGSPSPSINVNPASLNFGNLKFRDNSTVLGYTLSASSLTPASGVITIIAPAGFTISSTSSSVGFADTLKVLYSNGSITSKSIFVRMNTLLYGSYNPAVIYHSGGGTTSSSSDSVSLYGSVAPDPDNLTNSGTDFWVGFGLQENMKSKTLSSGKPVDEVGLLLYIASGPQTSKVKVSIPGLPAFAPLYYTIPPNSVKIVSGFPLGDSNDVKNAAGMIDTRLYYTGVSNRAIHVEVTNNVPVGLFMYDYATNNSAGGSMVFPTNTWNTNYFVQTYGGTASNTGVPCPYFFVIAKEDSTLINFKPTNPIIDSASSPIITGKEGGTILYSPTLNPTGVNILLNKGQVFNAVGLVDATTQISYDLTGSTVKSLDCSKPIAVFAGNSRTLIKANGSGCQPNSGSDNLIQQMLPKVAWGTKYLTIPTKTMEYNLFRIGVSDTNTVVKVDGKVLAKIPAGANLNWNSTGLFYQIEGNKLRKIEADKPITVTQFILPGSSCGGAAVGNNGTGDPEMILLSPVDQAVNNTTVYCSDFKDGASGGAYINVLIPKKGVASFKLDGKQMVDTGQSSYTGSPYGSAGLITVVKAFKPHPQDTAYYFAKFLVSYPAIHTISSDSTFNAIAYGIAKGESWGYNAGTAIKDLRTIITTQNPSGSSTLACPGNATTINISIPYLASTVTGLNWSTNHNPEITSIAGDTLVQNPVPIGTFTVNDVTYTTYASPIKYSFANVGDYPMTVTLYGTFANDCGNSTRIKITIPVVRDTVDFTFAPVSCGSSQIQFKDASGLIPGSVVGQYIWDFGDGIGSSTAKDTLYTYANRNKFNVKLRIINNLGCYVDTTKEVDLTAGMTAKIDASPVPNCLGVTTNFSGTNSTSSAGPISIYYWDYNDGSKKDTTTIPTTTHKYVSAGTYRATLMVATAAGCVSNTDTVVVTILPNPKADFVLPGGVCIPGSTLFSNTTTIGDTTLPTVTHVFDYGDGTIQPIVFDGIHKYTTGGPFTVKLVATSKFGCVDSISKVVTNVYPQPTAIFSLLKNNLCASDLVPVKDNSVANNSSSVISKWRWIFGDNTVDTLQNPSHYYGTMGTYQIRLQVATDKGCLSDTSAPQSITVHPVPVAGFKLPGGCLASGAVTFVDTSKIADNTQNLFAYAWSFGDPNATATNPNTSNQKPDATHTYTAAGTYQVIQSITSNNGCTDTDTLTYVVAGSKPVPGFEVINANGLCSGTSVSLKDTSRIAIGTISKIEILWDVTNPASLVVDNSPANGGVGASKIYAHQYPTTNKVQQYTVRLRAYSGPNCFDSASTTISINPTPIVGFVLPGSCLSSGSITFIDTSNLVPNDPTQYPFTYTWIYGDAKNATPANPDTTYTIKNGVHSYTQIGSYTIIEKVTTKFGCTASDTMVFSVAGTKPKPRFAINKQNSLCSNDVITLNDTSRIDIGSIQKVEILWDITDPSTLVVDNSPANGSAGAAKAYTHIYPTSSQVQQYTIRLRAYSGSSCYDSITKTISINPVPLAGFKLPGACLNTGLATFVDTSKLAVNDPNQYPFSYVWTYGDKYATQANPDTSKNIKNGVHTYTDTGSYTVIQRVSTKFGCTAADTLVYSVSSSKPVPQLVFANLGKLCSNDSVYVKDTSRIAIGIIRVVRLQWDITDPTTIIVDSTPSKGKIGDNKSYAHAYPVLGVDKTYTVKLFTETANGCADSIIRQIVVHGTPKVKMAVQQGICINTTRGISGASESTGLPGLFSYSGDCVSGVSFTPAKANVGLDSFKIFFTTIYGCKDSTQQYINIWPKPSVGFTIINTVNCAKAPVKFADTSKANIGKLIAWSWDFGDQYSAFANNISALDSPTHNYTVANNGNSYQVKLSVTNDSGCIATVTKPIVVQPVPLVDFTVPSSICLPDVGHVFLNKSTLAGASVTATNSTFAWNFGDGKPVATDLNPVHKYDSAPKTLGNYAVKLTVTSKAGCAHDTTISLPFVNFHSQPRAKFVINDSEVCLRQTMQFTDKTSGTVSKYYWWFGNGAVGNNNSIVSYTYPSIGTYTVKHAVIADFGCPSDTASILVSVNPIPTVNAGLDKFVVQGQSVVFSDALVSDAGQLRYKWLPSPASNFLNYDTLLNPTCTPLRDVTYTLLATGKGGCTNTGTMTVHFLLPPAIPNAFSPNGDNINDKWVIGNLSEYPGATVEIYDRSGMRVFRSFGYPTPWDGTLNGKPLPVATYYYIIKPQNGLQPVSGSITIVR